MPQSVFGAGVSTSNTGTLRLRRLGPIVTVSLDKVLLENNTGTSNFAWNSLPAGFRAAGDQTLRFATANRSDPIFHALAGGSSGVHLYAMGAQSSWLSALDTTLRGQLITGTTAFVTTDAWPTALPGTGA